MNHDVPFVAGNGRTCMQSISWLSKSKAASEWPNNKMEESYRQLVNWDFALVVGATSVELVLGSFHAHQDAGVAPSKDG